MERGRVFVVSGPSGSGKTTLIQGALRSRALARRVVRGIAFTTRPQRTGEKNKRDYFFISRQDFKEQLKRKKILEWTKYLGYYYGTQKDFVERHLRGGRSVILCLDIKGAHSLKRLYPKETVTVFISPGTLDALRDRISARGRETDGQEIARRLSRARQELKSGAWFDYRIENIKLKDATRDLINVIKNEAVNTKTARK